MNILSRLSASTAVLLVSGSTAVFAGIPIQPPPTLVSEPSTLILMGLGLAAAVFIAKKRK